MERALIYGMGDFFNKHKTEIAIEYEIVGYIDKKNCLNENDYIYKSIEETKQLQYDKIIIMVSKVNICFDIIQILLDRGIVSSNIVLGMGKYGEYKDIVKLYVNDIGQIVIKNEKFYIAAGTEDEFVNTIGVMVNECYKYFIPSNKSQVVFDIGMNIGDASLYFASKPEVISVYGFEPFLETYKKAINNIETQDSEGKIKTYNYGLSNKECELSIPYNNEMSCGQSTIPVNTYKARELYKEWELIENNDITYEKIKVKKSSSVIKEIMKSYDDVNFVLKIDCEGEEYGIFQDLFENDLLSCFSLIMVEWHYQSDKVLTDILEENKFAYVSTKESIAPEMGLIYAWRMISV